MPQARRTHSTPATHPATGPDWSRTYPVTITDDTAVPRYNPGDVVHVDPHEPVLPGDWALIVRKPTQEETAPVTIFAKVCWGDWDAIALLQLNPFKQYVIPTPSVLSIHRIVGSSEP